MLLSAVAWPTWYGVVWWRGESVEVPAVTAVATRGLLIISVTERGDLESSQTTDAICEVEGREIKIVSILSEGTKVTKGQEVAKFDAEKLNKSFAEQEIKWKQALGKAGASAGELEVQINKGETDKAKAQLDLTLAELAKEKYIEGDYNVELFTVKGGIELAEKDLTEAREKLKFYREFEKKGFGTPEQTRYRELALAEKDYNLEVAKNKMKVLQKFTLKEKTTELAAKAYDARMNQKRTQKSADGAVAKAKSDLEAAEVTAKLEKQELDRIQAQLAKCVMTAPQDGILVYAKDRYWDPSSRIQPGAMVYFRQTIFTIPDLEKMQLKVKVHESVVKKIKPGLKAEIVMDALQGQTLHGTVISVGTMAHQEGFWNQGGKEYLTVVSVDDLPTSAGLKPGMTGAVKVIVATHDNVLSVPVAAVGERDGKSVCFVVGPRRVERREVTVGDNNEKFVEVISGLNEGERVTLDARARVASETKSGDAPEVRR